MRQGTGSVYSIQRVTEQRQEDDPIQVWARWILRAESARSEHYVARAFDSLPKLRRYVRALRAFGFRNEGKPVR